MSLSFRSALAPGRPALKICIASGKGGVGKSTIAANLAIHLGTQGYSVVLVDGDLSLANLDILLGVIPERTVEHFFRENVPLSELMVDGPAGVRVLPAGSGLRELTKLGPAAVQRFSLALEDLASGADFMIIDCAAGIGDQVVDLALLSDLVMLVTWPDPAALVDSYALLKVLRQRNPVLALSLIANGVESESEAGRLHARVDAAAQRFLGRGVELQGWVPRDPNVSEASAGQVPICLRQPASPASRAIDALARSLIGETKGSLGTTLAGTFASSYATRELLH